MSTDTTVAEPVLVTLKPGAGLKQEPALHIPLGLLAPSPTNPRRKFDAAKLQELAESIRETDGVFQPILARPNPAHSDGNGQPRYEIVAGERRWRASKIAGMETVLALVRDLSDRVALQIQLKENVDRESLHELEEAEGIKRLMEESGATAEEVAHMLSKSRRWVFGRLALLNLCDAAREAFLADKFKATVAGLIARMPDHAQQAEATERIVAGFGGEPYSFRQAAEYLAKEFMLALAKAPFDIAATYQVAGPCGQCPKRSGANPDLFDDVKTGDMCQDSGCYKAKGEEAIELQLDAARDAGHTVLSGGAARQLMPSLTYLPASYQWFDKPCPALTDSPLPLREIFGAKARDVITLDHPAGQIVSIVPDASVRKLLKAKGLLRPEEPKAKAPPPDEAPPPADRRDPLATFKAQSASKPLSPTQLSAAIDRRSGELFGQMLARALAHQINEAAELPLLALRIAIERLVDDASAEANQVVFDAMDWPPLEFGTMRLAELRSRLAKLGGDDLGRMLVHALYAESVTQGEELEDMRSDWSQHDALAFAEHYQIDVDALQAEASEGAAIQVRNEEARRLGLPVDDAPADATDAFVQVQASTPQAKFLPAWPFPSPPPAGYAPREPAAASKPGIKYRNPATGETWSGRGLQPKWLKARLAEGGRLEDFLL